MRAAFFMLLLSLAAAAPGRAGPGKPDDAAPTDERPVRLRAVASVNPAGLGQELEVGALFDIAPGWHVYWTYPGNTGRPTRVGFVSDERHTKVLAPRFPSPQVFDAEHMADLSFGYSGSVLVMADAMVFEPPPGGVTTVTVEASWLACKRSCINGKGRATLDLAVAEEAQPSGFARRFARARAQVPAPLGEERARLSSLSFEKGTYRLRFIVTGLETAGHVIPRWLNDSTCKIADYGIEPLPGGETAVHLQLRGDNCLPGVGGVILGRPRGAGEDAPLQAFSFGARSGPPAEQAAERQPGTGPAAASGRPGGGIEESLLWMLVFALLGGMLLNVMPCVIPVVVPKILHVVRTAQKADDPRERRRLLWSNALAYTAGVLATMGSLAAVVVVLKAIGHRVGWGFQFQNPWFLVFMVALLLLAGLGMLKTFSLKRSCQVEDLRQLRRTRRRSPLLESFLTGLLVTFLGTPCTAPFLGPALGYAFTAPSHVIVLFLLTVGVGLAAPFLLLGAWTGWARILPTRVTERYDRVMRFAAFLLFGTMVWLLGVLAEAWGAEALGRVLWFLLALALGAWIFGLLTCDEDPWRKRLVRLVPLALAAGLFGAWILEFPAGAAAGTSMLDSKVGIEWQPFSESRVAELRASGKTVFIDFTAGWCMNCKANERLFIETENTKKVFDELDVATFKADHTRFDPVIQRWLERFGRAGVPMYIIFPACAGDDQAILLPEILTSGLLHDALRQAGPSKAGCR